MAEYIERSAIKYEQWAVGPLNAPLMVVRKKTIDSIPAADVAEVVHGKWEEWWPPKHMILTGEEMLFRCSVCDAKYSDKENMRYCPNCGARMDGDGDG